MDQRGGDDEGNRDGAAPSPRSCPSAQPEDADSAVIGVVDNRGSAALVSLLRRPVPFRDIAHLIPDAVPATEVLRFTAPCAAGRCSHFQDHRCTLAARVVARLPEVADRLAPCSLRGSCRWWHQEGAAACHRCPQVVTEPYRASDLMRDVATSSDPY